MPTMLTPHFTLEEFIASQEAARRGISNMPTGETLDNLNHTAWVMERVREILGNKALLISSGYRSPAVNAAVGGSANSAHMSGLAVDFIVPGFGTPIQVCHRLSTEMAALKIDQLIHEFDSWVHLGLSAGPPRHMALTIDGNGTRSGFA